MRSTIARPYSFIFVALGAVVLIALVAATAKALVLLFGGVLFAVALRSVASALARRLRLPYVLCFAAVALAVVGGTVAMVVVAGPKLFEEGRDLVGMLPDALHDAVTRLRQSSVARAIEVPPAIAHPSVEAWLSRAVTAMGTSLEVLGGIAVVFFVGLYGAAKPSEYARALLAVVPPRRRVSALRAARAVNHDLARWLFGRLVAMLFVGVTCGIAFALLGVPLAMTLAVLAGILTFVPYIGAVLSGIPPTLLAFTHSPTSAVIVLLVFTTLHIIEGYILTPLLTRATVHLPPAVTLGAQIVLTTLLGPLGLVFSTPLLVVLVSTLVSLRSRAPERRVRRAAEDDHEEGGAIPHGPRMPAHSTGR